MKNLSALACRVTLLFFFVIPFYGFAQDVTMKSSMNTYLNKHNFNASVLIQSKGNVLYEGHFGLANSAFHIANDNTTKHKIASVSKLFTFVLIYQLYEKGTLDLNEPISTYLPEYKGEGATKGRIHHLLTATSGITDLALKGDEVYEKYLTSDKILEKYASGLWFFEISLDDNTKHKVALRLGEIWVTGSLLMQLVDKNVTLVILSNMMGTTRRRDLDFIVFNAFKE